MEHNLKRLHKHVARLQRRMRNDRFMQIMRVKRAKDRAKLKKPTWGVNL
jgi:hypothetical protein